MNEKYHYGKGEVEIAEIVEGEAPAWIWLGDVSELTGNLTEESFTHRESYSGQNAEVREIFLGPTWDWSATLFQLDAATVARFTNSTLTSEESGTVTDEDLGNVTAGDVLQLEHFGVSNLVITDSADPAATIAAEHYEYDVFGEVNFLTLPSGPAPTNPLLASYSHTAYSQAAFLNAPRKQYSLRYKGINLAEGNKPVMMELYKVSPGLLQALSMITTGNQLASAPVNFKALLDTSKPANGPLGQYGRLVTVGY